jgi:hypothetical protein
MPLTFAFSLVTPVRSSSSSSECVQYSIWMRAGQRSLETLGTDSVLASYIRCDPRLRVPGCKNASNLRRERSEQEIDITRANTLAGRIVRNFGQPFGAVGGITHLFPTPEVLANADLESIGLPRVKADAIRALARGVRDGQISLKKLQTRVPLLTRLYEIPGIRRCAAQWVRETGRERCCLSAQRHLC